VLFLDDGMSLEKLVDFNAPIMIAEFDFASWLFFIKSILLRWLLNWSDFN
jgi:hypothetical protein